ncbi:hypothetical protein ACFL0M_06395 [Thermodesulfobacteriota bacterium]
MLCPIGYQKLKAVDELKDILKKNRVVILVDVRSKPYLLIYTELLQNIF